MDRPRPGALSALFTLYAACGDAPEAPVDPHPGAQLADVVVSAPGADAYAFGDPDLAVNGVRGAGEHQGSFDVYAIAPTDDELVLAFADPVVDGDGPDLAVFENPFAVNGGGWFIDPVVVEVSADCVAFAAFPHAYLGHDGDPTVYAADPAAWPGFAGLGPVRLHEEDDPVDPLSDDAGGDRFDLADLVGTAPELVDDGVLCVRLTGAAGWTDPATGAPYPRDPVSNGPDIDGVYARAP